MEGQSSARRAPIMSKDDDETDEEQRRLGNCLQQVLSNPLVCENIASFLSLADMKAASEVSQQFLHAIWGTRRFAQTAVLAITDKKLEDIKPFIRKTDYAWRGVKVDVTDPTNILEDLRRVLKSAEFVSLEGRPWMIEDRAEKDATAVNLLTAVLSSTPNLSQLNIDFRFLSSNVGGVLSSPAVQQTLRNLIRLDLTELNLEWEHQPRYFTNSDEEDAFWRNFGLLTGLPNRLKCFKLPRLSPMKETSVDSLHRSVLGLLRNNRATLEQLSLDGEFWNIHELQTLVFPALKTLTTEVDEEEETTALVEFLNNQKSLEELTLEFDSLEERLVASIAGLNGKLKKLDLTIFGFPATVDSWSFLGGMTCLEEIRFEFGDRWGPEGVGSGLLTLLPKNQLTGLSLESPAIGFYQFWSEEGVEFKTELLQGFRCLRRLRLVGWEDAVDDQLMQRLLKELSLLEELELSNCSRLTDAGISGDTAAEWGKNACLSDLRGLKTLKIWNCWGVTPEGILSSVKLPFLKNLEYSNPNYSVAEWVALELVRQNPRLERLRLDFQGDLLGKLKGKLMHRRVELLAAKEDDE